MVVLTDGLWKRRFGANPGIVGDSITLNAQPYTVIGVLPPSFSFLGRDLQVFVPMAFAPGDNMNSHNNYFLTMFGRLKPGVTRGDGVRRPQSSRGRHHPRAAVEQRDVDRHVAAARSCWSGMSGARCWSCSAPWPSCC